nr:immunoglobulin heavy chain junction region [Macaca mulatta]MOX62667.1 immunoglobulin heavy chain junction region [Macaca mulatta]MOX64554.1 immunoglobulin heavy chain junction region [Macaca mulatta]MOX65355.1 immunoglobulin heavy chain junction region [Macaca mulatta]MOX66509.1 immunoglobulin heavy chain junction region [Macaca mulatta]
CASGFSGRWILWYFEIW